MKLYEFKAKYISKLSLYAPQNDREEFLRDLLINKLGTLRTMTLPYFVQTLHLVTKEEEVTDGLKQLCRDMLSDVSLVVTGK